MRNKYPGICYQCGKWCDKGRGHSERQGHKWRVQHAECAIMHREFKHSAVTHAKPMFQELYGHWGLQEARW